MLYARAKTTNFFFYCIKLWQLHTIYFILLLENNKINKHWN